MATGRNAREDWMRPLSFSGLLRVLKAVAAHGVGLRAGELNALIADRHLYTTRSGAALSPTSLYHLRTALLRLGALARDGGYLVADTSNPSVRSLLVQPDAEGAGLTQEGRDAWASLVLANPDARARFFDLFMPGVASYDVRQFRTSGRSVTWHREDPGMPDVTFASEDASLRARISSPLAFQSVLYGVRYWARDELALIDEFFEPRTGSVMYPIGPAAQGSLSPQAVARDIPQRPGPASDWTLLSLQELSSVCCLGPHRPLTALHDAIGWLARAHGDRVVLIPTSPRMATLSARSAMREDYELRVLYRDGQGRYISHIRLHQSLFPILARV